MKLFFRFLLIVILTLLLVVVFWYFESRDERGVDDVDDRVRQISNLYFNGHKDQELHKNLLVEVSDIIDEEPGNIDALMLRHSMYLSFDMEKLAYEDLAKINLIEPVGERVLGECLYYRRLGRSKGELLECYKRSIVAFEKRLVNPDVDINYLLARLLFDSNDFFAFKQVAFLIKEASDPMLVETYKLAANEFLDEVTYYKLFPDER